VAESTAGTPNGALFATGAVTLVGASVAAASLIGDYPLLGGQAARYALASALLVAWAKLTGRHIPRPSKIDIAWLSAVAFFGMVLFNVFLILSTDRIDPSLVGAIVGTAPIVLAVAGALQLRKTPQLRLVAAAFVVAAGTALVVQARVEGDLAGLLLAVAVMLGEVGFSLLAVPVLGRIGPIGVSVHATWLAAAMLVVGAMVFDGSAALRVPTATEFWALLFLAVLVTAAAFVMWYSAVDLMGAEKAGLFAGLIPVSALVTSAAIGTDMITLGKLTGVLMIGVGVVFGARVGRRA
jgi:drug/metabolite transporter (DMT)-like permease